MFTFFLQCDYIRARAIERGFPATKLETLYSGHNLGNFTYRRSTGIETSSYTSAGLSRRRAAPTSSAQRISPPGSVQTWGSNYWRWPAQVRVGSTGKEPRRQVHFLELIDTGSRQQRPGLAEQSPRVLHAERHRERRKHRRAAGGLRRSPCLGRARCQLPIRRDWKRSFLTVETEFWSRNEISQSSQMRLLNCW